MNLLERQLQAMVEFLSGQRIKYAVLGGIAVSVYGVPRLTADIDVNIILDGQEIGEFLAKAGEHGFCPLVPEAREIAEKTGVIPLALKDEKTTGKFDIIIAENPLEYAAIQRARIKKIGAVKVRLITAEDLVIHKIASSRPRDREDLKGIMMRQRNRLDVDYVKNWLEKIDQVNKGARLGAKFSSLLT